MKIIERIQIKHFRSFVGTPKEYETNIENLSHLNIFSGSNDSGKSNILRALNLFFNNQVTSGTPFDFSRDFFTGKKESGHRVIEISVGFDLSMDEERDKFLPEKFSISKYYDRNGFRNFKYSFVLKEKNQSIDIYDTSEQNRHIEKLFLPPNATDEQKEKARKRERGYRQKFAGFLNKSIAFEYVPAIRDKDFFAQLFGRVISQVKNNEELKLSELQNEKTKIDNWEKTVKNKTEKRDFVNKVKEEAWRTNRLKEIEENTASEGRLAKTMLSLEKEINSYSNVLLSSIDFLESKFQIGKNLQDFFEGFDIGTGTESAISLALRGDGVQARFVPKILDFLSKIDPNQKYTIWGFEEPENSAEYKNQQDLATELKNIFSEKKQIFLTTHSEEFLHLYDGPDIVQKDRIANLYHVKKLSSPEYGEYSKVYPFNADKNEFADEPLLSRDLGQSYLRAKYSKEIKSVETSFLEEKRQLLQSISTLTKKLDLSRKPVLYVEDTFDQLYKIAWLKNNGFDIVKNNFESIFAQQCPFQIFRAEGAAGLEGFLRAKNVDPWKDHKIIGLFDFDQDGVSRFKAVKNETYWSLSIDGDKRNGFFKKRNDHNCFYAFLLPIPDRLSKFADLGFPSLIEVENLLPEEFLITHSFASKEKTTGDAEYLKIKDNKKSVIWEKAIDLDIRCFDDFTSLFSKIEVLFR